MVKISINGVFLVLLLLLVTYEEERGGSGTMMMMAEGRTCESQSHGFKGRCVSNNNCGLVCKNEGFSGGWCRGLRGMCFCTKDC
ncbi:defensin-like protein 1 [Lactuca sativa]|uniref:Knottins-like domain-containing protein n=1 Tax=Lactuca sativa TaxID=4236 RepID=A0A9R1XK14_LACSA|nr:defensin-like protein 1 [Lactuca sativa]KAJ0215664.1 hypothetical protein LSAT_V11C300104310 [Lactuca sativa]